MRLIKDPDRPEELYIHKKSGLIVHTEIRAKDICPGLMQIYYCTRYGLHGKQFLKGLPGPEWKSLGYLNPSPKYRRFR